MHARAVHARATTSDRRQAVRLARCVHGRRLLRDAHAGGGLLAPVAGGGKRQAVSSSGVNEQREVGRGFTFELAKLTCACAD